MLTRHKIQIRVSSIIENWVIKSNRNQKQEKQPKKVSRKEWKWSQKIG